MKFQILREEFPKTVVEEGKTGNPIEYGGNT